MRGSDNFFDIGGHSLLAVTFTTRVQRETGARLNLIDVATATLAVLATTLPATAGATDAPPAPRSLRERMVRWLRGERASEGSP